MWTVKKGRKFGGPVESHPIVQNENLVSSMRVQDLSDPYRNPCPSSTPLGDLQCAILPCAFSRRQFFLSAKVHRNHYGITNHLCSRTKNGASFTPIATLAVFLTLRKGQSHTDVTSSSRTPNCDTLQMPNTSLSLSFSLSLSLLWRQRTHRAEARP
jgi:hypothetical protein